MKQNRFQILSFAISLIFLSGTAIGADGYPVFSGSIDDDLYFNGVIFDDIQIPDELSGSTVTSSVEVKGTGSITIGDQKKGILPRILIFGGTTIKGTRLFQTGETLLPWEGIFTVPESLTVNNVGTIVFAEPAKHDKSGAIAVAAFQMGQKNETFSFDHSTMLALPVNEPDGKKILLAFNDADVDEDDIQDEEWIITEGEFCIVENETCTFELTEMNSVALVREIYNVCPREVLAHGKISKRPECMITCDNGYELNELANDCVEAVAGDYDEDDDEYLKEYKEPVEWGTAWDKGYIRYRPSREQLDYVNNTRARPLSDQLVEDVKGEKARTEETGFFNYLLAMRNRFGENSSPNIKSAEATVVEENSEGEETSPLGEEEFKSTAPLLPASGPGVFAGIAAIGMGMMVFGVRKK